MKSIITSVLLLSLLSLCIGCSRHPGRPEGEPSPSSESISATIPNNESGALLPVSGAESVIPEASCPPFAEDSSRSDYEDPYPLSPYWGPFHPNPEDVPYSVCFTVKDGNLDAEFSHRQRWVKAESSSRSPSIGSLNPLKTSSLIPYTMEMTQHEGERLGFFFSSSAWFANRSSLSSDAPTNWLTVYPHGGIGEKPAFRLDPQPGMVIQGVALGTRYIFWTETSPMPLDVPGWALYQMDCATKETVMLMNSRESDWLTFPQIGAFGDTLYLCLNHAEGYGELVTYSPQTGECRHVLYRHCQYSLYAGFSIRRDTLLLIDYDDGLWQAVIYHPDSGLTERTALPLKYPSEYIYNAQTSGDWVIYTSNMLLTYAYNTVTGETRVLSDNGSRFLLLSDRYVLLHFTFQSLVLHDLYNDTYHELTELDLKGGRPEVLFQSYSLSQTEEAVYVYESKPYVSPALLVKIYIAGE